MKPFVREMREEDAVYLHKAFYSGENGPNWSYFNFIYSNRQRESGQRMLR